MGIPTGWNLDTPKGLETQLSVRIRRILPELLHSTKLELGKLHRTRTDFDRTSMLELLQDSQQTGKSSSHQNLTSLSTPQE
jgi:hypothetical protein